MFVVRYYCCILVGAVAKCGWDRNVTLQGPDEMRRRLHTNSCPFVERGRVPVEPSPFHSIRYLCTSGCYGPARPCRA